MWYHLLGWKLNPMFGAAAMSLSSFCVVMNALRLNLVKVQSTHRDKPKRHAMKKEDFMAKISVITGKDSSDQSCSFKEAACPCGSQNSGSDLRNINSEKEITKMEKTIEIKGMMCGNCEKHVKKALEAVDGVISAEASHEKGTAVVQLSADVADDVLKKAVEDADYEVSAIH